jgi:hypothetical protein
VLDHAESLIAFVPAPLSVLGTLKENLLVSEETGVLRMEEDRLTEKVELEESDLGSLLGVVTAQVELVVVLPLQQIAVVVKQA